MSRFERTRGLNGEISEKCRKGGTKESWQTGEGAKRWRKPVNRFFFDLKFSPFIDADLFTAK